VELRTIKLSDSNINAVISGKLIDYKQASSLRVGEHLTLENHAGTARATALVASIKGNKVTFSNLKVERNELVPRVIHVRRTTPAILKPARTAIYQPASEQEELDPINIKNKKIADLEEQVTAKKIKHSVVSGIIL